MLDVGLLILRIAAGGILAAHGAQKVFGAWGGPGLRGWIGVMVKMNLNPPTFWGLVGAGVELVGGLFVILGLLWPLAPLALFAQMLIPVFRVHWAKGFWNTKGGYEYSLSLLVVGLALGLTGPGLYSLDAALGLRLPEPGTYLAVLILGVLGVLLALNSAPLARLMPRRDEPGAGELNQRKS